MKKMFVFCCLVISFYELSAQAPIIDTTWLPIPGDKYYNYVIKGQANVSSKDTGANIEWDFGDTFSISYFGKDSFDFALPTTRHINCLNSSANLSSGDSSNFNCYKKDSSGLKYTDWNTYIDPLTGYFIANFSRPLFITKSNFHFRESYTDTAKYTYYTTYHRVSTDSLTHGLMVQQLKYDGYGILKVAGRQFDTAIRIHELIFETDSQYAGSGYWKGYSISDAYIWFVPSIHVPFVTLQTFYEVNKTATGFDTTATLHANSICLISGNPDSLSIIHGSDNPLDQASATFNSNQIIVNKAPGGTCTFAVFDALGQQIQHGLPRLTGKSSYSIDIGHLSPGLYILEIKNQNGQKKSIKIIKQF